MSGGGHPVCAQSFRRLTCFAQSSVTGSVIIQLNPDVPVCTACASPLCFIRFPVHTCLLHDRGHIGWSDTGFKGLLSEFDLHFRLALCLDRLPFTFVLSSAEQHAGYPWLRRVTLTLLDPSGIWSLSWSEVGVPLGPGVCFSSHTCFIVFLNRSPRDTGGHGGVGGGSEHWQMWWVKLRCQCQHTLKLRLSLRCELFFPTG